MLGVCSLTNYLQFRQLTSFWCHVLICWTTNSRITRFNQAASDEPVITVVEDSSIKAASVSLQDSWAHRNARLKKRLEVGGIKEELRQVLGKKSKTD
jgi:hypothetical protein